MTGARAILADSASSVAALDAGQPLHNQPRHNVLRDESVPQHLELVPCQPAIADQQLCSPAVAMTDVSEEETAIVIDEKVERGVTAADDGRRSV